MFSLVREHVLFYEMRFIDSFLCKIQLNTRNRVYWRACQVALTTKMLVRLQKLIS